MTGEARHLRCPEDVLGWIPWYSDGSLTDRQRGAVEAHASECSDCRAELDMIAGAPFEIDIELPDPDRAFSEIMARIGEHAEEPSAQILPIGPRHDDREAEAADRSEELARIEEWMREDSAFDQLEADQEEGKGHGDSRADEEARRDDAGGSVIRGPWMKSPSWAAAAAILLVSFGALAGTTLSSLFDSSRAADVYDLAAAPADPSSTGAAMIDVVFHESATAGEVAAVLRSLGGEIVSGPTNLGVYRVRLAPESRIGMDASDAADGRGPSALDVEVALSRLKAEVDGVAIFAEVVP